MAALPINKVTNANVYIDGSSMLGKALEVELPQITQKTAENSPLGQIGVTEYFTGFEKMEATIKWTSIYKEVYLIIADPFKSHQLQLRSNIDVYDSDGLSSQKSHVVYLTCQFKKVPTGTFKAHENVELESELSVTYIKVEIDGTDVLEFDAAANIYKVEGVDKLEQYRANLGA